MFSFTPLLATANIIPRPIVLTIPTPVQKAPMDSRTPVFQRAARIPPTRITKPTRYNAVHFIKAPPQPSHSSRIPESRCPVGHIVLIIVEFIESPGALRSRHLGGGHQSWRTIFTRELFHPDLFFKIHL